MANHRHIAVAVWGVAGVLALLGHVVPHALDALRAPMGLFEWAALAASVALLGYFEGYRGFQRAFAPRVVVRALHLARTPRPLLALLAPAYCMGLLHATRKRLVANWILLSGIVAIVAVMGQVPQPWRGFVDAGVAVALGWGGAAIVYFFARALTGRPPDVPADLP